MKRTVFLACPYGQVGGGMGSIMAYLVARGGDKAGRFRFAPLETRGGGRLIWSPIYLLRAILRVAGAAIRGRVALVHVNLAERGSVWRKCTLLFATKLLGVPVLLHLHAAQMLAFYGTLSAPARFMLRTAFRSADRCVVLGGIWRDWLIGTIGVPAERVRIVRNGVPDTPLPRVQDDSDTTFRILFLGNLLERKGVADLIHALARPELSAVQWQLTFAGGGPVETYRKLALSLGVADRVQFTGWVDQTTARDLLRHSDTLILPAYDEGLPLVILEALASGVPVICTPVGAIPEVIEDGQTALFVQPGDHAEIAAAIARLSKDRRLQDHLSAEGRDLYDRMFTMDAFIDSITELYCEIIRPGPDVKRPGLRPLDASGRTAG